MHDMRPLQNLQSLTCLMLFLLQPLILLQMLPTSALRETIRSQSQDAQALQSHLGYDPLYIT